MKVLLDTCVWGRARKELESQGHSVVWSGDWPVDPGDEQILEVAHKEGRVLVTLDKDFGELAIVHQKPHSGIIRLVNLPARQQARFCNHALSTYGEELVRGAIVTVELGFIRIRTAQ